MDPGFGKGSSGSMGAKVPIQWEKAPAGDLEDEVPHKLLQIIGYTVLWN